MGAHARAHLAATRQERGVADPGPCQH
jgi:hypothetical protein